MGLLKERAYANTRSGARNSKKMDGKRKRSVGEGSWFFWGPRGGKRQQGRGTGKIKGEAASWVPRGKNPGDIPV